MDRTQPTAPGIDLDKLTRYEPTDRNRHHADFPPGPMTAAASGEYVRFADVQVLARRAAAPVCADERALYEAWELREAERFKGEPLTADEVQYVLKRWTRDPETYERCPHHWPAFRAGVHAALAQQAAPAKPSAATIEAINPPDLPKFMPGMFQTMEECWNHAVLTGWRHAAPTSDVRSTDQHPDDAEFVRSLGLGRAPAAIEQAGAQPVARVERIISPGGVAEVVVFLESALKVGTLLYSAPAPAANQDALDAKRFVFEHTNTKSMVRIEFEAMQGEPKGIEWWRKAIDAAMPATPITDQAAGKLDGGDK